MEKEYEVVSQNPGLVARNDGDHEKALQAGGKTLESAYQVPYLEHACMEPMNATAHITRDACTMDPHPEPGRLARDGRAPDGAPARAHHDPLLGGGFGRRGERDFVVDALETAKAIGGGP